jgi:ribosomal protein S14
VKRTAPHRWRGRDKAVIEKMIEMWDKMHKTQLQTFERWQGEPQWKECTRCKKQGALTGTIRGLFGRKLALCEVCVFELRLKGLI